MNKKTVFAASFAAAMLVPAMANAEQDRISPSEKGSLLIFSDVEVVTGDSLVLKDTFISMTNDFNQDVRVQMYFIRQGVGSEWVWTDNEITLTANQPIFWSANTGNPAGGGVGSGNVTPWTSLGGTVGNDQPFGGGVAHRGFILAWAVDFDNLPIRWNHLSGSATVVDYLSGYAWEYNAWASQVSSDFDHGAAVAQDGTLAMDGAVYAQPYNELLLNFYAPGSLLISQPSQGIAAVVADTRLTLHTVDVDLRMNGASDSDTKAAINVWNMNETKFSNTSRCISCWDTELLSNYTNTSSVPNNFLLANIQTRAGKARINGTQDSSCSGSSARALLGVSAKYLSPVPRGEIGFSAAGSNLIGMGVEDATIRYDALAGGPDEGPGQVINALRGARRGK